MAAGSTSSSFSSTSNTLTFAPGMAAQLMSAGVTDVRALIENLSSANRHAFLQPNPSIPAASLQVVKDTLDAFAGQVSDEQLLQLKEANKKRKRAGDSGLERTEVLKIRKVQVDGFETSQVWQQARRIIASALNHSKEALRELEDNNEVTTNGVNDTDKILEFGEDGYEVGSESEDDADSDSDSLETEDSEDEDVEVESGVDAEDDVSDEEVEAGAEGASDEEADEEDEDESEEESAPFVEDPNGLNDGFFSIDDFNKQTQYFEEQDYKGDPYTDQVSDEEDIDWNADPMTAASKPTVSSKGKEVSLEDFGLDADEDEEEDEEEGPTFGNMDLNAPEGASDDENMDDDGDDGMESNANDVFYKDFFAPPARKGSTGKQGKSVRFEPKKVEDDDVERAMADVRRDLFDEESENEGSDDALSEVSAGDPKSRRSAHERRQAKLAEEIRQLEAASVAKRTWTLSGEATAAERPLNSLLEEDLDFEHVGKPVPVITAEVSESIEELIKRRILAQEFDEVLRRRPDSAVPRDTRRGLIEIDDTKASKSLAEIYAEDQEKAANPDTYVSKTDEKLRKEEHEIELLWADVGAKLDALSSWHYRPRPAAPLLTVVADAPTVSMEDAQPATAQGVAGGESMLAPQEVYRAGAKDARAESREVVVARSGLPLARAEMSREDKTRRRRREKERIRKAGGLDAAKKPLGARARMQRDTVAELKRGGVRVVNRKGEVLDMEGKKAKAVKVVSSSSYKL